MAQQSFLKNLTAKDFISKIPQFKNDLVNPDLGTIHHSLGGSLVDEMPRDVRELEESDFTLPLKRRKKRAKRSKKKGGGKKPCCRQRKTVGGSKQVKSQRRLGGKGKKRVKRQKVYKGRKQQHKIKNSVI